MKKILFFTALMISVLGYSQDFSMQDGTFTRCEPDRFFDSGGEFGSYGDDESFTTTICAPNADEFIILDFVDFSTQLNADILTIYDGDDTTAPVIGTYSGVASPGTVIASTDNASGCLTITFTSNGSLNTTGWEANITCAVSCQTITPEIVSTTPAETFPNVVEILPGETVDFVGGATFSVDGTNATYSWTFGDGNVGAGTNVSNTYAAPGTYLVTLTVEDDNPIGCDESTTFFVNVLDPIVTINNSAYPESSYTLEELVENVLVSGGCSSVDNFEVQVSGTPGALQTKSYGYFTRGGAAPNFPFEEGIVLSTGRAFEGGNQDDGPGTTASTNLGLGGDADLEALFLPTDPSFNSNDATYVKFSFVPTDTAISFRYIMFSEEYDGSTECSFADAFAFLLREVGTTEYTNLAVLDDGTPVSVTNINNSGTCTANPAFFNGYELGDTNYGGRTIALTATAPVTPNVEYEIKLVVADEGDSIWDSAIFLEAGSFNLGGDLGDDVTIAAGTAECGGTAVTLDTQAPTATHTWYYSPTDDINNATLINGETGSTIDVTDEGYYYVDVVFAPGCENSSDIFVQFKPNPVANTAPDLSTCDADGTAEFDLSENDDDVLGSQNPDDFVITYHLTEQDAIDNVGALPTNYTNVSNPQTIWVRIADASQECFDTTSFQLLFTDITTGSMITPIQVCDGDTIDGIGTFTLTDRDAEVIGANDPDNVSVTYHLTETDAEDDQSPLASPYNNTTPNSQLIYARLEDNNNEECYAVTSLTLEVLGNPTANAPIALEECDDDTDGFTVFTLSDRDAEVIGVQTGVTVTYHSTPEGAIDNTGVLPNLYTNTTANAEEVYVRIENGAGCYDTTTLQLIVNPLPDTIEVSSYELCDNDNPGDEQEQFDLPSKDAEILAGQVNVSVRYYTDAANTNEVTGLYTNVSNPETIYAVLTNDNTGCSTQVEFDLIVNPLPALISPTPLEVCDDGTPDGLTAIDLSVKNAEISGGNPVYSVTYYFDMNDAELEENPLAIPYTNVSNPQTIYARVENIETGCFDTTALVLEVEQAPVANTPTPLYYCDPDNDGFGVFDLTAADNEITGGEPGLTVTYHETFANADNNVDAIDTTVGYNNISEYNQTLYVRVESATIATDCATFVELALVVEDTPQLIEPTALEACDDASADGFALFNLTSKEEELLNGADPTLYDISYYETEDNAHEADNPITNPTGYTNTVAFMHEVWVRVEDPNTAEGCYKVVRLELIVNPLPVLVQPMPLELCDVNNPGDEQEAFTLEDANAEILNGQTGISLTYYETEDDADNAENPISSPYVNTMNAQTIYVRAENDVTGCYSTITVTLRVNPIPSPEADPDPIEVCDDDNDGFVEFDLEIRTVEITNGESDVVITYHETQEEAIQGDNAITGLYTNIVANNQLIYVRAENTITGCFSLTQNTLELIVVPAPEVPSNLEPLEVCDTDNDGFAPFDLTERNEDILGNQDPTEVVLTYHVTADNAETGDNPIINVGNYTNTMNPQTIYVRLYNPTTGCQDTGEFEIIVQLPPEPVQPTPLEVCDDLDEVPGDEITVFDLTVKDSEITGGNASWSVAYYETSADAQSQTNAIPDPTAYTNTSVNGLAANPQTLYVVVTDTDTGCTADVTMTIRVLPNPTPTPSEQIPDLELCDDINTGDGVEVFDLTENEVLILNGENGVTPTYHESSEEAYAGENAIADPTQYTNVDTPEQDIYVRVTNDATGCYAVVNFTIFVHPLPEVVAVTDFIQCELNTDGFDSFDLTTKDDEVLNGQDPTRYIVTYHETLADAESEMNALVSPYTNISNPQEIYVTITDNVTGCSISTQRFNLQVDEAAQANPDLQDITYEACDDNIENDGDPSDDSTQFTLSTQDEFVLDGQDPANYIVTYYATEADANLSVNPLPDLYENVVNPQVVYARVDNNTLTVIPIALDLTALNAGLDLDANGTIDTYDTDADGVFDLIDVDGDGLSDGIDANADGLYEFVDTDGDGNGDPVDLNNDGVFDNQQDGSVCYEVAPLTLQVNPKPNFDLAESYILCIDTNGTEILDPLVLDTGLSDADYSFEWTFNGEVIATETGSSMMPTQEGTYGVLVTDMTTSTETNCETYDETLVIESAPPTLIADVVTQVFGNSNVIEALATGISEYEYSLDGGPWEEPLEDGSIQFTGVSQGLHTVTARDKNGCGITSMEVFVIDYPKYFTPNGDGIHETWNIEGIGSNAKIYIFDRYGKLLKQISPTGQGWDGTFNGNNMPSSDYWFTVEYEEPLTNQIKEFKAHFTLKR